MSDFENALKDIFSSILKNAENENRNVAQSHFDNPVVSEAIECLRQFDLSGYHYRIDYPLKRFSRGLISTIYPGKRGIDFILSENRFLELHFSRIITRAEGLGCSMDKTRTIIRSIARYLATDKRIEWNYNAQYTFNLPEKVFVDHDEIIEFYEALHSLHLGRPDQFIKLNERYMQ